VALDPNHVRVVQQPVHGRRGDQIVDAFPTRLGAVLDRLLRDFRYGVELRNKDGSTSSRSGRSEPGA